MSERRNLYGAIEAGGTKFVCAVAHSPREILETTVLPTRSPEETFGATLNFFSEMFDSYGPVRAVGVGSFGPIDIDAASRAYGTIGNTPKPGWTGVNVIKALAPLKAPVVVDTDVNAAGLGEGFAGAGQGFDTFAYVTVGTGIGVGVIKNGRPMAGFGHYELGHIRPPHDLGRDPYEGRCPYHGDCLEGLAAGPAILDRWGGQLGDLDPDHDGVVLEAEYLSHLALTLIFAHMPERIIFGGGVMKTPGLMAKLRAGTAELIGGYVDAGPLGGGLTNYIVPPALGDRAGVAGAVALAGRALADEAGPCSPDAP